MDQPAARKILQELVKREDLKNKTCVDCGNPNPQWASLSFAVFLCLQCAGTHRGFGVHISFVRSISMDTWQEEQIKRMQLGGNAPFREFMRGYSSQEQGGYSDSLTPYETYHCWAATQYREKLDAALAGKDWSPSAPPEGTASPSSTTGLRKSRASNRTLPNSSLRNDSYSPSSQSSPTLTGSNPVDQKTANESYFASLGATNASRPDNLPPSQGGRYQGFGSTPSPALSSPSGSSFSLSSRNAPTLSDIQENPMAALSKGWSLFSSAVVGASRTINESVIQPGMEKVTDPTFQASIKSYVSDAQKKASEVGASANSWGKNQFGVDVAENVGGAVSSVRERVMGSGHEARGYGKIDASGYGYAGADGDEEQSSALYHDKDDDFFQQWNTGTSTTANGNANVSSAKTSSVPAPQAKKNDWDDEWKDF